MSSSSSVPSCDDSEKNNFNLDETFSIQSSIENDDSMNEENLFPLSIEGNDYHTQEIATNIISHFKTYPKYVS